MNIPFLVVNPRSANGATARHFDQLAAAVRSALGEFQHAFTARPLHARELARDALRDGAPIIVAVGGDGTINEVVNGFFEELNPGEPARAVQPGAALAIVPRGTGGDLWRTLGLAKDLAAAARALRGQRRPIDLGRVDYLDDDGVPKSRLFVNVSDVGVGARIVSIANRGSKALGGKLTFLLSSIRGLVGWSDAGLRARIDGSAGEDLRVTSFAVANGRYFGGGMLVAPDAKLDDGLFHLTIWSGFKLSDFLLKSAALYDGSHVRFAGTRTVAAREVALEPLLGEIGPLLEADGELLGRLPARFTLLPAALPLLR